MTVTRNQSEGYNGYTKRIDKPESTFSWPDKLTHYVLSNGVRGMYSGDYGPTVAFSMFLEFQEQLQILRAENKDKGRFGA